MGIAPRQPVSVSPISAAAAVAESGRSGLGARVARGAALAGGGFFVSRGLTFLSYLIIAQLIAPRDAGTFAAGTVVVGFGFVFAESGMLAALIQWTDDLDRASSTAAVSSFVSGLLLTGLAVAVAPIVGWFFHNSTVGWVAAASAGLLLLRALEIVPDAILQRRFSFLRRVVIEPVGSLLFGAVAIACCAAGLGVWGLVAGMYARHVGQVVASWSQVRWRPNLRLVSFTTWRQLASYARHVVASEVLRRSYAQLDSILLGRFAGTALLGQYGYGFRVASTAAEMWTNVGGYVVLPAFARIADNADRFRRAFLDALTVMLAASIPVAVLLFMSGDQLALFVFGPKWTQTGTAIRALSAIVIGHGLTSISSEVFKAAGRPQLLTRTHVVGLVAASTLLPVLLWALPDVSGIAIGVSAVSLLTGMFALGQAGHILNVSHGTIVRDVAGLVAAAGAAVVAAHVLSTILAPGNGRIEAGLYFAVQAAIVGSVYVVTLRLLSPRQFRRLRAAAQLVARRSHSTVEP